MKEIIFEGKRFDISQGRDVGRGGRYLELSVADSSVVGVLAEVFLYEATGDIVFRTFQKEVSVELVEFLIVEAKNLFDIKI